MNLALWVHWGHVMNVVNAVNVLAYAEYMRGVRLFPSALEEMLRTLQQWGFRSFQDRKPEFWQLDSLWASWCDPASEFILDPDQFDADRLEDDRDLAIQFHAEIRALVAEILLEFVDQIGRTVTTLPRVAIMLFRDYWTSVGPFTFPKWKQYQENATSFWDGIRGHDAYDLLRTLEGWYGLVLREMLCFVDIAEERLRGYTQWRLLPRVRGIAATRATAWSGRPRAVDDDDACAVPVDDFLA
jgi:hypothetical protein